MGVSLELNIEQIWKGVREGEGGNWRSKRQRNDDELAVKSLKQKWRSES